MAVSGAFQLARLIRHLNTQGQVAATGIQGGITSNSRVKEYSSLPSAGSYVGEIIAYNSRYYYWNGSAWNDILGVTA